MSEKAQMKTLTMNSIEFEIVDEYARTKLINNVPDYWQTALDEGADKINNALCRAGSNKSAFLFYTDAHWTENSKKSPVLLKYLYDHTGITKTFFGGDIIEDETDMSYLWDWRKQLKALPNHHSVIGNHDDGNGQPGQNNFSEAYVYGYLRAAEETPDIVSDGNDMYYYIDSPSENTRYLFLDTAYRGATGAQLEFIKQALLNTPEKWHIVAISHIWFDADDTVSPPAIGNLNSDASQILDLFDAYNSRIDEFTEGKAWVEFCIGGHTHQDYDATSTGGIPIILIETDSSNVRNNNLTYTEGTTTESSVNGIIADYNRHIIHIVRIGRGSSRDIEVTNYNITNMLSLALAKDSVSIYGEGNGWKADTRYSASSTDNSDTTATGVYITGYIPITANDVVYLKNVSMKRSENNKSKLHFFRFISDGTKGNETSYTLGYDEYEQPLSIDDDCFDTNGNLIKFTVPNSPIYSYVRIQCGGIDNTSIITVNEPIE